MKLQRTTWVLLILALSLGGGVALYELQIKPNEDRVQAKEEQIFRFEEEDIQKLTIVLADETLEFERTDNEQQPWQMKQPEDTPASDAAVSFLVGLLVGEKRDRTFTVPTGQLADYGLDDPLAHISVELKDQQTYQLTLGKPDDLGGQFYYATIASPDNTDTSENPEEETVALVSQTFEFAVQRDLAEWKQSEETVTESEPGPTGAAPESSDSTVENEDATSQTESDPTGAAPQTPDEPQSEADTAPPAQPDTDSDAIN